jgi:hypothetical protein
MVRTSSLAQSLRTEAEPAMTRQQFINALIKLVRPDEDNVGYVLECVERMNDTQLRQLVIDLATAIQWARERRAANDLDSVDAYCECLRHLQQGKSQ